MEKTHIESTWYPGDLSPHLFYIQGKLIGMAAAIPRVLGEIQTWEAFDMRQSDESGRGPILLGVHSNLELAKQQIENLFLRSEV